MKELVVFDVDNTIVSGQSQMHLVFYLYKKGYLSVFRLLILIFWFLLYKIGFSNNPKPAMEYGLSLISGKSKDEVKNLIESFFNEVLVHKIYKNIIDIIKGHKDKGRKILLLSNAPDVVISRVVEYLGADDFISTKLEAIGDVYTGKILGNIVYGKEKAEILKSYITNFGFELSNVWAYADHDSDFYLLDIVGHPNVVNPTKSFKIVANKNKWPIMVGNI